ncbi:hypothetical protein [Sinimarinibacterium sp. NLF-5-8]|uniref:hypothetical protein n=1 Tax=Sinimarinibacterium sp. NLF-5-8 TaxID=2698684 RepID=UPI00137BB1F2|nr:hypothetical protein [Sinimarinibacterium sp. NLF-5-8]QHS09135.1 hypothetical protein GT972_02510 [Sinimarinibacterium sp. NLF-5-8]
MLKPAIWIGSLALAGMLGYGGHTVSAAYAQMQQKQEALNKRLAVFKATYESLQDVERQWQSTYQAVTPDIDVLRFHRLIGLDRFADTPADKLDIKSVEQVRYNDVALPLYKVCMANESGKFVMRTPDLMSALASLTRLSAQPDISADGMALAMNDGGIRILMPSLCTFVRTSSAEPEV